MGVSIRKRKRAGKTAYYADVSGRRPDGSRFRKERGPFDTRDLAFRFGLQLQENLMLGTYGKQAPALETFSVDFLKWSKTHNRPSSVEAKTRVLKNHIVPGLGAMRLDAIRAPELSAFEAALQDKGLSTKSIYNVLAILRKMLRLAEEWEVIERAPKVKSPRLQTPPFQFLDFEEANAFLAAASRWPERLLFLRTALETGMRSGELRALKWGDIDSRRAIILVQRNRWRDVESGTKAYRIREVPIAKELLGELKSARHLKSDYVFCRPSGAPLTASEVKDWVPAVCRAAGLKRLTLHGLRHSYASQLTMLGETGKTVQELLGHGSGAMTARYTHLTPDFKRAAVDRLAAAIHGERKKEKAENDE